MNKNMKIRRLLALTLILLMMTAPALALNELGT